MMNKQSNKSQQKNQKTRSTSAKNPLPVSMLEVILGWMLIVAIVGVIYFVFSRLPPAPDQEETLNGDWLFLIIFGVIALGLVFAGVQGIITRRMYAIFGRQALAKVMAKRHSLFGSSAVVVGSSLLVSGILMLLPVFQNYSQILSRDFESIDLTEQGALPIVMAIVLLAVGYIVGHIIQSTQS